MDLGPGIDSLPDDWTFQLGLAYLTAAQSCGFTSGCAWVADSNWIEPNCAQSQLVAMVDAGWTPDPAAPNRDVCLPYISCRVTLYLDQCVLTPDGQSGVDPVKMNENAQANLADRWKAMRGLQSGHAAGTLSVAGARITPALWTPLWTQGGCARWQTVWTLRI